MPLPSVNGSPGSFSAGASSLPLEVPEVCLPEEAELPPVVLAEGFDVPPGVVEAGGVVGVGAGVVVSGVVVPGLDVSGLLDDGFFSSSLSFFGSS